MIDGNATLLTLRTFNATEKTFFSSNINFCYVFYSALTIFFFFLGFNGSGEGGGVLFS